MCLYILFDNILARTPIGRSVTAKAKLQLRPACNSNGNGNCSHNSPLLLHMCVPVARVHACVCVCVCGCAGVLKHVSSGRHCRRCHCRAGSRHRRHRMHFHCDSHVRVQADCMRVCMCVCMCVHVRVYRCLSASFYILNFAVCIAGCINQNVE